MSSSAGGLFKSERKDPIHQIMDSSSVKTTDAWGLKNIQLDMLLM